MLDINLLKKSGFFQEVTLKAGDILFDEGDINTNIYIIVSGELYVQKYTTKRKNEIKVLATLKNNEIFGEAALMSDAKKEVKIVARRATKLIAIEATKDFDNFSKKHRKESSELLKYIIYTSNKRLLDANLLITANHKISQEILKISKVDNKKVFQLIDKIQEIIEVDYILYLEKNPVIEDYGTLKYDTRIKGKMLDQIINLTDKKLEFLKLRLNNVNHYIQALSVGNNHLGSLIFFRKNKGFTDSDKKILTSIGLGFSGIIKEKKSMEEQRNKNYMEN